MSWRAPGCRAVGDGGQHRCCRQDAPDSIWESQSLIVSTCGRGHGCVCVRVSGAVVLGNWREETRRLKEVLQMVPGGWHSTGPPANPGQCQGQRARGTVAVAGRPACHTAARTRKQEDIARPPRLAGRPPQSSQPGHARCWPSDRRSSSQPRGRRGLLPVCVLSLVCCADCQRGSLRTEQARDVPTKLERKVKPSLSVAKEPLLREPQRQTSWHPHSSSGSNDNAGDATHPSLSLLSCMCFEPARVP